MPPLAVECTYTYTNMMGEKAHMHTLDVCINFWIQFSRKKKALLMICIFIVYYFIHNKTLQEITAVLLFMESFQFWDAKCKLGLPCWLRIHLQCRRSRFNSWVGKISWRREWQPTPVFLPGESHEQRNLVGYTPWGHKESDTTEAA